MSLIHDIKFIMERIFKFLNFGKEDKGEEEIISEEFLITVTKTEIYIQRKDLARCYIRLGRLKDSAELIKHSL